jgi:hypothetical protein
VLVWDTLAYGFKDLVTAAFGQSACPRFEPPDLTVLEKEQATLASVATFKNYGTVVMNTHGAIDEKGNPNFMTGEPFPSDAIGASLIDARADYVPGRVLVFAIPTGPINHSIFAVPGP